MNKPLALFDIDKTMYDGLSYFPLLEAQIAEGLVDASIGDQATDAMGKYKDNSLDYEEFVRRLLDIQADGLKGIPADDVEESTNKFFYETPDFFEYVRPTVNLLSETHEVALVTGSSQFTARAVARVFGVTNHVSTQLGIKSGILNGTVQAYLATRHEKQLAIEHLTDAHPYEGSFGFGDSEGDIAMLQVVEHAICIRPTPGLTDIAIGHGWTIVESQDELGSSQGLSAVKLALAV